MLRVKLIFRDYLPFHLIFLSTYLLAAGHTAGKKISLVNLHYLKETGNKKEINI